jgi:UDP-2,3-diacylglucosamine hydrolase
VLSTPLPPFSLAALPPAAELEALPAWAAVDFISDLHLHASEPWNFIAWRAYMQGTTACAVLILGDLFEVWFGDDALALHDDTDATDVFQRQCVDVIAHTAARIPVFFMHGNRDFLVGADFIRRSGAALLNDPTVLGLGHPTKDRYLLTHGDALCLDDVPYQQFRAQVRSESWQQEFLTKPLAERKAIALNIRAQSAAQKGSGLAYADVDNAAAQAWLTRANSRVMIHGHTHKPAHHVLANGLQRIVLTDWDVQATPPRGEVLRLQLKDGGTNRLARISLQQACL